MLRGLLLPPGYLGLLHGPRGAGKSSLALVALVPRAAAGVTLPASSPGPGVTYYTSEMDPGLILSYADRMGVELADVLSPYKPDDPTLPLGWDFPSPPGDLILDSLSALGRELDAIRDLRRYCEQHGRRALLIAHETKGSAHEVRGSSEITYGIDLEIRVTSQAGYQLAEVTKNRFGGKVSIPFTLSGSGVEFPAWDRYYSIEGEGGAYSVRTFPPGGPYADPYRHASELGKDHPLPEPPCAVAAQFSPLYPGGWIEPPDVGERRAFAARLGLPFWSPHGNTSPAL